MPYEGDETGLHWDIWGWLGKRHSFIELKQAGGRDRIRPDQVQWFRAALSEGVPRGSFCVVEWSTKGVAKSV